VQKPGEKLYVVEAILDYKRDPFSGERMFLVKWQGYPDDQNSWAHESTLANLDLLKSFKKRRRLK
jgi:chromobox protein 1